MSDTTTHQMPAVGSRWLIQFGFDAKTIVITAVHEDRLAWESEDNCFLSQIHTFQEFQFYKPIPLPPKTPLWKRALHVLGLAETKP